MTTNIFANDTTVLDLISNGVITADYVIAKCDVMLEEIQETTYKDVAELKTRLKELENFRESGLDSELIRLGISGYNVLIIELLDNLQNVQEKVNNVKAKMANLK